MKYDYSSTTVGEYFRDILDRKGYDIDILLEYIDKYDILDMYNKEEFLILFYKLVSDKCNNLLIKRLKKDFNIRSDLSYHFLGRLLMRFKDDNIIEVFRKVNKLIDKAYYNRIVNNRITSYTDNEISIIYKSSINVTISIYKNFIKE